MNGEMVESYLRDLIADLTDGVRPERDGDGDLPVAYKGSQCYVRVSRAGDELVTQTFSVVSEVEYTHELADALNEMNHILIFTRAFHVGGQILLEHDLFAQDLDRYTFSRALFFLASATRDFGPQLVEKFGGIARFDPVVAQAPDPPGDDVPGLYL